MEFWMIMGGAVLLALVALAAIVIPLLREERKVVATPYEWLTFLAREWKTATQLHEDMRQAKDTEVYLKTRMYFDLRILEDEKLVEIGEGPRPMPDGSMVTQPMYRLTEAGVHKKNASRKTDTWTEAEMALT